MKLSAPSKSNDLFTSLDCRLARRPLLVDTRPTGEIEMKNYRCSLCSHVSCMACVNRTWKSKIPQTGGMQRPCDATANLVCCQCGTDQRLTCWFEVASPHKATRTT